MFYHLQCHYILINVNIPQVSFQINVKEYFMFDFSSNYEVKFDLARLRTLEFNICGSVHHALW